MRFELLSFENKSENARDIMRNFGRNIDVVAGIYSLNLLKERNCEAFHLYDPPICCAVFKNHPLVNKKKLKIKDLFGQTLLMLQHHYFDDFDKIRADLLKNYPLINIEDISFFYINIFNQCANENKIMLAIPEWKNIHPMLKIILIDWNYAFSFSR